MEVLINKQKMKQNADQATSLLKNLASPSRLMILCQLIEKELSVGDLLKHSSLSQSAFSQHLARLRQEGLVKTHKKSQTVYYRLANDHAVRVIQALHDIYC